MTSKEFVYGSYDRYTTVVNFTLSQNSSISARDAFGFPNATAIRIVHSAAGEIEPKVIYLLAQGFKPLRYESTAHLKICFLKCRQHSFIRSYFSRPNQKFTFEFGNIRN